MSDEWGVSFESPWKTFAEHQFWAQANFEVTMLCHNCVWSHDLISADINLYLGTFEYKLVRLTKVQKLARQAAINEGSRVAIWTSLWLFGSTMVTRLVFYKTQNVLPEL